MKTNMDLSCHIYHGPCPSVYALCFYLKFVRTRESEKEEGTSEI
jgi:hypothetical protein